MYDDREFTLLRQIRRAKGEEWSRLVSELEAEPVLYHQFYSRWLRVHDVSGYDCWTDDGFDPDGSEFQEDVVLLWGASYGHNDICNGGLHQFFGNPTGVMAPEMVDWFRCAELPATATVLEQATLFFGNQYPRRQEDRRAKLPLLPGRPREEWDPFDKLTAQYYSSFPSDGAFDAAADRWLREVCGIEDLRDE